VKKKSYDLILMDMQMPEMDGLQATQRLLASMPSSRTPSIVAFTANVSHEALDECMSAGCVDYISKPFSIDRLCQVLWKIHPVSVLATVVEETGSEFGVSPRTARSPASVTSTASVFSMAPPVLTPRTPVDIELSLDSPR